VIRCMEARSFLANLPNPRNVSLITKDDTRLLNQDDYSLMSDLVLFS